LWRISPKFSVLAHEEFISYFTKADLTVAVHVIDNLSLSEDDEEFLYKAWEFGPDVILRITPVEYGGPDEYTISMATLDAFMFDVRTGERFWRAEVEVASRKITGPLGSRAADKVAKDLVKKFESDGLLHRKTVEFEQDA
jgi:hypothetical protein